MLVQILPSFKMLTNVFLRCVLEHMVLHALTSLLPGSAFIFANLSKKIMHHLNLHFFYYGWSQGSFNVCNRRLHHHLLCELCISLARIFPSTSFDVFSLFEGALYKCRKLPLCSVSYIYFLYCLLSYTLWSYFSHRILYLKFLFIFYGFNLFFESLFFFF